MEYHTEKANELMDEMEVILSNDTELSYDEDMKLQKLFYEVKKNIREASDIGIGNVSNLKSRFKNICSEFDTPDEIIDASMNDMFPDDESMEGFDWSLE